MITPQFTHLKHSLWYTLPSAVRRSVNITALPHVGQMGLSLVVSITTVSTSPSLLNVIFPPMKYGPSNSSTFAE